MDCRQYLARFSDYFDGQVEAGVADEMETHRSTCERCARYSRTLESGREILRALPSMDVPSDFRPRLDHRIFHLEDGASIARQSLGSGATMVSVLAIAVLTTLSAWAPAVSSSDEAVELPTLVVVEPPAPSFTPVEPNPTFPRNLSIFTTTEFQDGIWGDSHDLLRDYSRILERRRDQAHLRVGIE
jgi:hypothetical protein